MLTNVFSRSTLAQKINFGLTVGIRKQGCFSPALILLCLLKATFLGNGL